MCFSAHSGTVAFLSDGSIEMWLGIPGEAHVTDMWFLFLLLVLGSILNWREGKEGKEKHL